MRKIVAAMLLSEVADVVLATAIIVISVAVAAAAVPALIALLRQ